MDWLCVSIGPEFQENGLSKLRKWTQSLLRNPTISRLASQVSELESLALNPRLVLLLCGGQRMSR